MRTRGGYGRGSPTRFRRKILCVFFLVCGVCNNFLNGGCDFFISHAYLIRTVTLTLILCAVRGSEFGIMMQ